MSESTHARLSPSGAKRWMACPGSVALEANAPNESNPFAREGTCAHLVAAECLTRGHDAAAFIGREVEVEGELIEVTEEMAGYVQQYVDVVRQYADGHELMVEQRVPIGHLTGEQGAEGTSDAIIVTADGEELIVIDLKFGRGVLVTAEENEQAQIYALGALEVVGLLGHEPKRVRVVIHQPRVSSAPSEWDLTVEKLQAFGDWVSHCAKRAHVAVTIFKEMGAVPEAHLSPGEDQCRFCKVKATCPALAGFVQGQIGADFEAVVEGNAPPAVTDDAADLGLKLSAVDLIRDWCDAVEKRAHAELIAGNPVPGYKLVQGKRGARAWTSEQEAEASMKSMRLKQDEMYSFKVISPTQAEKLLAKDSPRRWTKLQELIAQAEGKPTVAKADDPRPALEVKPVADEFTDVSVDDLT